MNKLMLIGVAVLALGCSKKRVPECDAFAATIDKLAKCDKLPADSRATIEAQGKAMHDALKMLDDAGGAGNAPQSQVDQLANTCKTQEKMVVEQFAKIAPDCVK